MTLEDTESDRLEDLVSSGGRMSGVAEQMTAEQKTMAFFAGMSEPARRKLGPEVLRLHKAAVALLGDIDARGRHHFDAGRTSIALAATTTIADLRKIVFWYPSAIFCRVLVDRRPDWLAEGIELVLERMTSSHGIGPVAQELNCLVAQGLIEAPRHDHYAIGVAFAYYQNPKLPPLDERLLADIDRLAPAIWRQFEVEGGGEISLANFDKFRPGAVTWGEALKILAEKGHLDRKRLLEASLDALNRGFSQYRAGWFSRFHELLVPTLDERVRCVGRYLDLLASPISPTVTLAVSALKAIDKAGSLSMDEVVERIAPALHAKSATTVKGALALLAKAAKSERRRSAVLALAAIGLEHRNSEIQVLALDLIEHHVDALNDASRTAIAERLDIIGAPLRPRALALLGNTAVADANAPTASPAAALCNERATLTKLVAEDDPRAVLVLRSQAMSAAIKDRRSCVQLSAPTHAGHWIDPIVLVERSFALSKTGPSVLRGVENCPPSGGDRRRKLTPYPLV